jgi:hypothetical protein
VREDGFDDGWLGSDELVCAPIWRLRRDQPVVLDDLDKLYADSNCVRLLKPLCNTERVKRITWLTNITLNDPVVPTSFVTTSNVILVANERRTANPNVAGMLRQVAFRVRLDAPGDSFDQVVFVMGRGLLPENVDVLGPELFHGHPLQGGDFFAHVQRHVRSPRMVSLLLTSKAMRARRGRTIKAILDGF